MRLTRDYHLNDMHYTQTDKKLNYEGFTTFPQNLVNFGSQTDEITLLIHRLHCPYGAQGGYQIATVPRCCTVCLVDF